MNNFFSKIESAIESIMSKNGRRIVSSIVLLFGFFIVVLQIIKSFVFETHNELSIVQIIFIGIISGANYLTNILYCIVVNKAKSIEYLIIPGLVILISEYGFFHDYSTWIVSDANAAIGLVIAPIPLLAFFGVSILVSFLIVKIRKKLSKV